MGGWSLRTAHSIAGAPSSAAASESVAAVLPSPAPTVGRLLETAPPAQRTVGRGPRPVRAQSPSPPSLRTPMSMAGWRRAGWPLPRLLGKRRRSRRGGGRSARGLPGASSRPSCRSDRGIYACKKCLGTQTVTDAKDGSHRMHTQAQTLESRMISVHLRSPSHGCTLPSPVIHPRFARALDPGLGKITIRKV